MSRPRTLDALRALRAPLVALCTVLMLAGALVGGGARAADGTLGAWCIGGALPTDPSGEDAQGIASVAGCPYCTAHVATLGAAASVRSPDRFAITADLAAAHEPAPRKPDSARANRARAPPHS